MSILQEGVKRLGLGQEERVDLKPRIIWPKMKTEPEETNNVPSQVRIRENHGWVLLPEESLAGVTKMVEERYLHWLEEQGVANSAKYLGRDPVHKFEKLEKKYPNCVVVRPDRPGTTQEEIAREFGGEIGVSNVGVTVLYPKPLGIQAVAGILDKIADAGANLAVVSGEYVRDGTKWGNVIRLTKAGESPEVSVIGAAEQVSPFVSLQGLEIFVQPVGRSISKEIIPAFGEEKQAMLDLTRDIAAAFGHKVA